jgi:hypothetical protein
MALVPQSAKFKNLDEYVCYQNVAAGKQVLPTNFCDFKSGLTVWVAPPHSRTSRLPGLREAGTGLAALRFNGSASFRPEASQGRPYGMASGLAVSGRLPLAPRRQPKSQFYDRTPKSCRGLRRHISLQISRVSSPVHPECKRKFHAQIWHSAKIPAKAKSSPPRNNDRCGSSEPRLKKQNSRLVSARRFVTRQDAAAI